MARHTPKGRLDALTDGVFAVAMTLLVIDLKLPESFHPASNAELFVGIAHLANQIVSYVVSFFVLGIRWISMSRLIDEQAKIDRAFVLLSIGHLFLITCMPFSTMVVGRFIDVPAAVWLYGANTTAAALMVMVLVAHAEPHALLRNEIFLAMLWLLFVVALSVVASFYNPALSMWFYALNILPPLLVRRLLPAEPPRRR
jgi:uncharacterized membrane protein